jgi:hypothetical protein
MHIEATHNDHHTLTTLVLLDPTSDDGEAPLHTLTDDDHHVRIVVLLSGRTSAALREYAASENLALADAGWIYLDQVAERLAATGHLVETVLATGPDPVAELALLVSEGNVGRIVLPPSMHRLDPAATRRVVDLAPVVTVAEAAVTAA